MKSNEELKKQAKDDQARIKDNLHGVKRRIAVFSGKGGVGKTTVSVNLAYALQCRGAKAGILDADITGPNVAKMLGVDKQLRMENQHIVPHSAKGVEVVSLANAISPDQPVIWRGPMRSKVIQQFLGDVTWGELDYLVADLPPGTGDEIITIAQNMSPDLAIIVTTPQDVALLDSLRAINLARRVDIPKIALVENMSELSCPDCGCRIDLFGTGGGQRQAAEEGIPFLGALPIDIEARKQADAGKPFILEKDDSPISIAINAVAEKVEALLPSMELSMYTS